MSNLVLQMQCIQRTDQKSLERLHRVGQQSV